MKRTLILVALVAAQIGSAAPPISSCKVWLDWNPISATDFSHYLIYRTSTPESPDSTAVLASVSSPQFIDTNILAGQTFYYWVAAVDQYGNQSDPAGPLEVTVNSAGETEQTPQFALSLQIEHQDADQDPADPFVDRSLDNDHNLGFSWEEFPESGISYKVFLSQNSGPDLFLAACVNHSYEVATAQPGNNYRLRVDVLDAAGLVIARGYSQVIHCEAATSYLPIPEPPEASAQK